MWLGRKLKQLRQQWKKISQSWLPACRKYILKGMLQAQNFSWIKQLFLSSRREWIRNGITWLLFRKTMWIHRQRIFLMRPIFSTYAKTSRHMYNQFSEKLQETFSDRINHSYCLPTFPQYRTKLVNFKRRKTLRKCPQWSYLFARVFKNNFLNFISLHTNEASAAKCTPTKPPAPECK